jgi:hypothetical protein
VKLSIYAREKLNGSHNPAPGTSKDRVSALRAVRCVVSLWKSPAFRASPATEPGFSCCFVFLARVCKGFPCP